MLMASFLNPVPSCHTVTPMLALDYPPGRSGPTILAGQFRVHGDPGHCITWLNAGLKWWPSRVCNSVRHELGHLNGQKHPIPRDKSCRP